MQKMRPDPILFAFFILFLCGFLGLAQEDETMVLKIYQNALKLLKDGKTEEALGDFVKISKSYPNSEIADDALMQIGNIYYPYDDINFSVDKGGIENARDYYTRIVQNYVGSNSAPIAYFKLGLMKLDPRFETFNINEAFANFERILNIYQNYSNYFEGYFGKGLIYFLQKEYPKAIGAFSKIILLSDDKRLISKSYYYIGLSYIKSGNFLEAMKSFGKALSIREESEYLPKSSSALKLAFKIYRLQNREKPVYKRDSDFTLRKKIEKGIRRCYNLRCDGRSNVYILDEKEDRVAIWNTLNNTFSTVTIKKPNYLFVSPQGIIYTAEGNQVRVGGRYMTLEKKVGTKIEVLKNIQKILVNSIGEIFIGDKNEDTLQKFGRDLKFEGYFSNKINYIPSDMEIDSYGNYYFLNSKDNFFEIFNAREEKLMRVSLKNILKSPVDLTLDLIGNVYVLDDELKKVSVYTNEGFNLGILDSTNVSNYNFQKPKAIAMDNLNNLYIYDEDLRDVLRFQ
ncbi:MAG: outer membrane protein assembly factor BamD [Acidobacteriota bacterium]